MSICWWPLQTWVWLFWSWEDWKAEERWGGWRKQEGRGEGEKPDQRWAESPPPPLSVWSCRRSYRDESTKGLWRACRLQISPVISVGNISKTAPPPPDSPIIALPTPIQNSTSETLKTAPRQLLINAIPDHAFLGMWPYRLQDTHVFCLYLVFSRLDIKVDKRGKSVNQTDPYL